MVAGLEKTTKKHAAEILMRAGLERWMGEKIGEWIMLERKHKSTVSNLNGPDSFWN
jgi:hypothetical protein